VPENAAVLADLECARAELDALWQAHQALERELARKRPLADLGWLAAGVMHDVNNALQVVSANAGTAREKAAARGSQAEAEAMEQVLGAVERAAGLARRLLDWAGRPVSRPEPVELGEIAGDVLELLRGSTPVRIRLVANLPKGLPPVLGVATDLRRLVLNLVTNAWQACEGGRGVVEVATGACDDGRHAWIEVADDGRGMDAATRARAFEPFFSTREDGHGLGLSLVREIVERHHGTIEVASRPGEGTRFRVTLPSA
jgi:signal transduction histidine kinase